MNTEELVKDFKKLQYQVKVLSECMDYEKYPVEYLILSMNWDQSQINKAHDIFQKYDQKLKNQIGIRWFDFERALCDEFKINYQSVKSIILAFHRNQQWVEVCHGYAMSLGSTMPVEFQSITGSST
jgi:lipid II:glycine glycyltransferase (peptidoglycan interpeptide bridge formation enzyme)